MDTEHAQSTSNFLTSHTVESLCPQLLNQLRGAVLSLLVITLLVLISTWPDNRPGTRQTRNRCTI